MKILMTADPIGGVWSYALELCAALESRGAEIMLATLGRALSDEQRAEIAELPHVRLRESRYRLEWMTSPWESLAQAGAWLRSLEQEFRPALIHFNHLVHGAPPWHAPVVVAGHSCVLSWSTAVHGEVPAGWTRYRQAVTESLRAADLVVAPTQAMMSALITHYGPLRHRCVIANARDPRRFHASGKQPFVLCAGRVWDDAKNIRALCEIAESVRWPIFVAGAATGPDGQALQINGVRMLGALSSEMLAEWYARAAIYALPARYEPFGLTALEAALSRCALVLGDIPSLREVWGDAACYVPPDDPGALRDTINRLISNPAELHARAAWARARARAYTPRRFGAEYWNAYRSLLEPEKGRTCASYSSITL